MAAPILLSNRWFVSSSSQVPGWFVSVVTFL